MTDEMILRLMQAARARIVHTDKGYILTNGGSVPDESIPYDQFVRLLDQRQIDERADEPLTWRLTDSGYETARWLTDLHMQSIKWRNIY